MDFCSGPLNKFCKIYFISQQFFRRRSPLIVLAGERLSKSMNSKCFVNVSFSLHKGKDC